MRKTLIFVLKLTASGLLLLAIYRQLFVRTPPETLRTFFDGLGPESLPGLLLAMLLMLLNWGLEAQKWRLLLAKVEHLSFARAFEAILGGLALSLFTPNRVGEYGGRVLLLQKADKLVAVALTLVGSLAQIVVNCGFGLVGSLAYVKLFMPDLAKGTPAFAAGCIGFATLAFLVLLYFRLPLLAKLEERSPRLAFLQKYVQAMSSITNGQKTHLLLLSAMRYGVYALQYVLLLWAFGCEMPFSTAFLAVSAVFFAQTVLPTIAILELGIRGNLSLFFIGRVCGNQAGILASTLLLWVMNLALPALAGMAVVLLHKKNVKA